MPFGPRERLITAAIELVSERGVEGAGLTDLLGRSSSARRSIYQHFPGGKLELIEASTRAAGEWMRSALRQFGAAMDAPTLLTEMIRQVAASLVGSDYRLGCPIAAAAAVSADAAGVREAAAAVFAGWVEEIEALLVRDGREREEAHSLAGFLVSAVEGAMLCARATRSTEPLDQAAEHLTRLLAAKSS
jgi:TetR/AcrR family transcriptional repressor of lmrAB and yxaGH operons